MKRAVVLAAVLAMVAFGGCASTSSVVDVAALTKAIGRDACDVLREIGSATDAEAASELARAWREKLDGRTRLALLRLGLGSDDERAVFGAALLLGGEQFLYVPEIRNAAARIAPRIGMPDCPVTFEELSSLYGAVDMPAMTAALSRLTPEDAQRWSGELHRIVRPENIPALCEQTLTASSPALRRAIFANANLAFDYSDQHASLLIATYLRAIGRDFERDRMGLPGPLAAALSAFLEATDPATASRELQPRLSETLLARELLRSEPSAGDLPLLERLVASSWWLARHAALLAMGTMHDDESLRLLRELADDKETGLAARAALAKRGDSAILETMLAADVPELAQGLSVATPERRRVFAAELLALPTDRALERLRQLSHWTGAAGRHELPPYDDAFLDDLEPLAVATQDLDARVLRKLLGVIPGCATSRMADALLARPAGEVFAPERVDFELGYWNGELGYRGPWAFLEVTRPEAFRRRLREGLHGDDEKSRSLCAVLLARMGDTSDLDALVAQLDADGVDEWCQLARTGDPRLVQLLRQRLESAPESGAAELLRALAVAAGMPANCAKEWSVDGSNAKVREAILRGDPVEAFLQSAGRAKTLERNWLLFPHPRVLAFVAERRARATESATELSEFDMCAAIARGDRAQIAVYEQFVRDGRYAVQEGLARTHARDLSTLDLWVSELGTDCCHVVAAESAMSSLFGCSAHAFDRAKTAEPAMRRLQRTLLPKRDRLRWSHIANAFVIAGD